MALSTVLGASASAGSLAPASKFLALVRIFSEETSPVMSRWRCRGCFGTAAAAGCTRATYLGGLDGDGWLYLTDRSKEVIERGGQIVSLLEVEEVVLATPPSSHRVRRIRGAARAARRGRRGLRRPASIRGLQRRRRRRRRRGLYERRDAHCVKRLAPGKVIVSSLSSSFIAASWLAR